MASMSRVLYVDSHYVSPYAMSAFVALHEKVVPFDMVTVDLASRAHEKPTFAAQSVTGRIPVFVQNGFSLSESSAISEYLDDCYDGTPLYPAKPEARARARQLQAWLRSDLMPIREERPTTVIFYRSVAAALSPKGVLAARKLFSAVEALLSLGSNHLFGRWSIADLDVAVMLNRLVMSGDPVPDRLASYARSQWDRESVRRWVNQHRPPLGE